MTVVRMTGQEFQWFGKGQFLASRYEHGEAMNLDLAAVDLARAVGAEAGDSPTGPASLRRISARFRLDADAAMEPETEQAPYALGQVGAARRIRALHRLASSFDEAAEEMEARLRPGP